MKALLIGTLLPDLIDKPLYILGWLLSKSGIWRLNWLSSSRTLGHSLLLLLLLCVFAALKHTGETWAIAAGTATHLFLDFFSKLWGYSAAKATEYIYHVLLWPLFGFNFPDNPLPGFSHWTDYLPPPFVAVCEIVGFILFIQLPLKKK